MLKRTVTIDKSMKQGAASISHANKIFIIGGWEPASDETYEVDVNKGKAIEKGLMLCKKGHASFCQRYTEIYSIGGWNGSSLNDCEKYSIYLDRWSALPNLNTSVCELAAFMFNLHYIYAICGFTNAASNIVEKLTLSENSKWEYITMTNPIPAVYNCLGEYRLAIIRQ